MENITQYLVIGADGLVYGPVPAETVRQWMAENRVNAFTLVQVAGSGRWTHLYQVPELVGTVGISPRPPVGGTVPAATGAQSASAKIPAGICGVLLGFLGIHKFILGYTGPGLIMLLVSVLTCGLGAPIMWMIGFIEGIIYLTCTDEEFVRRYVYGRRGWF